MLSVCAPPPEGTDTQVLLDHAARVKVSFLPGASFWVNCDVRNTMRLNFSNGAPEKIEMGIDRLGKLVKASLAGAL